MRAVTIAAGWGWAICAPTAIPVGGPGVSSTVPRARATFPEHHGTIFHGKQVAVERIVHVLACLAEGLGIRATARVFEVDPNTVLQWLVEAAEQLRAFSAYFLCDLHVTQMQLDELYAVLSAVKAGEVSEAEAIKRLVALAPLGLGGDRSGEQTAAGDRRRGPHAGDGAARGPSGRPGVGAGLCPAVSDRWL